MTVDNAIKDTRANYAEASGIHILVDARDVLNIIDEVIDMCKEENENSETRCVDAVCRELEFAKFEIQQMNIESPYRMKVLNEQGDVDTYVPEDLWNE